MKYKASQFIEEYQYLENDSPPEHSPDVVLHLLKGGVIKPEEARRMLGLFDESRVLCHK